MVCKEHNPIQKAKVIVKHVSRYEMKEQKLAWFSISLHDDFVYVLWEHHNFDLATPFSEGPCVLKSSETKQVDKTQEASAKPSR